MVLPPFWVSIETQLPPVVETPPPRGAAGEERGGIESCAKRRASPYRFFYEGTRRQIIGLLWSEKEKSGRTANRDHAAGRSDAPQFREPGSAIEKTYACSKKEKGAVTNSRCTIN